MRTRTASIILALLVISVVLFLLWRKTDGEVTIELPGKNSATVQKEERSDVQASTKTRVESEARDLPLVYLEKELLKQAKDGAPQAACRIAAEYEHCHEIFNLISKLGPDAPERIADGDLAYMGERDFEGELAHCEGVKIPDSATRLGLWRDAAAKGSISGMVSYATGAVLHRSGAIKDGALPAEYVSEAGNMLRTAARAGDYRAIYSLAEAYSPDTSLRDGNPIAKSVPIDAKESLVLNLLLLSASNEKSPHISATRRKIEKLKRRLSESEIAAAQQESLKRKTTWGHVRVPENTTSAAMIYLRFKPAKPNEC